MNNQNKIVLLKKEYNGFESFYDYFRDVSEIFEYPEDRRGKQIKGEFLGKIKVSVTFYPEPGDIVSNNEAGND